MPKLILRETDRTKLLSYSKKEHTNMLHESETISTEQRLNLLQQHQQQEIKDKRKPNEGEVDGNSYEGKSTTRATIEFSLSSEEESESDKGFDFVNDLKPKRGGQGKKSKKNVKNLPFPQQLHDILSTKAYYDIIRWQPHGEAFIVLDKKKFVEVVSKNYFKETKYESFTRKLNRWNFVRIFRGPDDGAFQHEFFSRDDVSKSSKIRCQKKHERKSPRPGALKKKKDELLARKAVEKARVPMQNALRSNDFAKLSCSSSLSSLEDIKKAQMEQVKRRNLLNYFIMKQQYEILRNREFYHQQLKAQVSDDACKKQTKSIPCIPRLEDVNTMLSLKASEQQEQKLLSKISPTTQPKNTTFPVIPTMPSISIESENDDWKMKLPFEVKRIGSKLEVASNSAMPASSNELQLKRDNKNFSMLVDTATSTQSSKEFYYQDSTDCNLPPKKKIQKRLSYDEADCSIRPRQSAIPDKDQMMPIIERASAA